MNTMNQESGMGLTRRDFIKTAGLASAAFLMPAILAGSGYAANPGVTSMTEAGQRHLGTDVLVIGGGMAGAFAAITARAQGLNVTLVDKGVAGRSGQTPWANGFAVFDEAEGHDREEWDAGVRSSSEYVNNLDWLGQMLNDSRDRWQDLVSWGLLNLSGGSIAVESALGQGTRFTIVQTSGVEENPRGQTGRHALERLPQVGSLGKGHGDELLNIILD